MTIEELEFALTETVANVVYPERIGPLMHSIMLTVEDWAAQMGQESYDDGHSEGVAEAESALNLHAEAEYKRGYSDGYSDGENYA